MKNEFLPYVKLVEFFGNILGNNSEVVLHDVTDLNNSIVAIKNSHISGRKVGGPATDLVLKILNDPQYNKLDYLCGYQGELKDNKILKSSTFFIRDNNDKIIGMLCVNTDCSDLVRARDTLNNLIEVGNSSEKISERLNLSAEEIVQKYITGYSDSTGISIDDMTQKEKREIVKNLYENGTFKLKGTVTQTALLLKVSEPTVYRYLSCVKRETK